MIMRNEMFFTAFFRSLLFFKVYSFFVFNYKIFEKQKQTLFYYYRYENGMKILKCVKSLHSIKIKVYLIIKHKQLKLIDCEWKKADEEKSGRKIRVGYCIRVICCVVETLLWNKKSLSPCQGALSP